MLNLSKFSINHITINVAFLIQENLGLLLKGCTWDWDITNSAIHCRRELFLVNKYMHMLTIISKMLTAK